LNGVKIREAKDDKEVEEHMQQVYGKDSATKMSQPLKFIPNSSMISFDENGKLIAPETRQIKCGCGNNVTLFLVQAPTAEEFAAGKFPVWASYCTKCKGGHVRGHSDAVMKERDYSRFLKMGHKRMRECLHRRRFR